MEIWIYEKEKDLVTKHNNNSGESRQNYKTTSNVVTPGKTFCDELEAKKSYILPKWTCLYATGSRCCEDTGLISQ